MCSSSTGSGSRSSRCMCSLLQEGTLVPIRYRRRDGISGCLFALLVKEVVNLATEMYMVCDKCGMKELTSNPRVWLKVIPMMASQYAGNQLVATSTDEALARLVQTADMGEFCSLRCLGEWALARDNLKVLDKELGHDG